MKKNIEIILQDLYELDPSLKMHKKELEKIIEQLLEAKPDVEVTPQFLKNLRSQLRLEAENLSENKNLKPNPISMFKRIFLPLSGLVAIGIVVAIIVVRMPEQTVETNRPLFAMQNQIVKMEPGAFGPLSEIASSGDVPLREATGTMAMDNFSVKNDFGTTAPSLAANPVSPQGQLPLNDSVTERAEIAPQDPAPDNSTAPGPSSSASGGTAGIEENKMVPSMIVAPDYFPTVYKYVYKGEPLALTDSTVDVFKRIPQKANSASLAATLKNFGFGLMDLSGFGNLQAQYLSLKQDQNEGYILDINFDESSIGINQNWEKWDYPSSKCGDDAKCYESTRLKEKDIPDDATLISIADRFLTEHRINTTNYGKPVIQKQWKGELMMARQQGLPATEIYVPDNISIVYPTLLNGETVSDQGGNPMGLTVGVNIYHKKVGNVYGLRVDQFQSSAYNAVTDWKTVEDYLEKGGTPYPVYYDTAQENKVKVQEVELGAPTKILVSVWNYNPEKNEGVELYTPALKFPIIQPAGQYLYQENLIVPLAKDLLQQEGGMVRPMTLEKSASGIIPPSAPVTTPQSEPSVTSNPTSSPAAPKS